MLINIHNSSLMFTELWVWCMIYNFKGKKKKTRSNSKEIIKYRSHNNLFRMMHIISVSLLLNGRN